MRKIHIAFIVGIVATISVLLVLCSNCRHSAENEIIVSSADSQKKDTFDLKSLLEDNPLFDNIIYKVVVSDTTQIDEALLDLLPAKIKKYQETLLFRKSYIASYNKELKIPNWVAWHLTAEHADGKLPKKNSFREDLDVPFPRATSDDYKGSGWTRGHMCPSGDTKWDEQANHDSFLLTNICPQDAKLNSGLWNSIEMDCRKWAKQFGDLFIVCGPLPLRKPFDTIGENKVAVPRAFFKVVLSLRGKPNGFGFVVKNNEGEKKNDLHYHCIRDIERLTGYDFFPMLNDSVENLIENHLDTLFWYPNKKMPKPKTEYKKEGVSK